MSEMTEVWYIPFRLFPTLLFVTCYVLGGRSHKWIRRFLGSGLFIISTIIISIMLQTFDFLMLPGFALIPITMCFGYGADTLFAKFVNRFIYGSVLATAAIWIGWFSGNMALAIIQAFLTIIINIGMGAFNPIDSAVKEEAVIATGSVVFIPFLV